MKKRLSVFLLIMLGIFSYSQVIFKETFDGISGSATGGPGTYNFPPGWLLRNVDNKTPFSQVGYVNEAWERREDFQTNVIDSVAFSTSYYEPAGQADDWMWTPKITLPDTGADVVLKWNAKAFDPAYADGYEVRIMVDPTEPTGGPGVMGNQLTSSVQLFNIAAENSSWTERSVSLNSYRNKTFRIAFRNNSTDKFILVIDDVEVSALNNTDAAITAVKNYEYTQYPLSHSAAGLPLNATIKNMGSATLTGARIRASLINETDQVIATVLSVAMTLNPQQESSPDFPAMPVLAKGKYRIRYEVALASPDQNPTNNMKQSLELQITESTMARDSGVPAGTLGIGANTQGYLGQAFTTKVTSVATGATVSFGESAEAATYRLALWNVDPATGKPLTIIAETATQTAGTAAFTTTLSFAGAPVVLAPGTYVLTAVELDAILTVGMTNDIFTPGTTFVNWPGNPLGVWAHNEDFGSNFAKSYALRLEVQQDPTLGTSAADLSKLINIYPNPVTDVLKIASKEKVLNLQVYAADGKVVKVKSNPSLDHLDVTQLPAGMYVLKLTTAKGEQQVKFIKK